MKATIRLVLQMVQEKLSDLGVKLNDLYNAVNTDDYPILSGEE